MKKHISFGNVFIGIFLLAGIVLTAKVIWFPAMGGHGLAVIGDIMLMFGAFAVAGLGISVKLLAKLYRHVTRPKPTDS